MDIIQTAASRLQEAVEDCSSKSRDLIPTPAKPSTRMGGASSPVLHLDTTLKRIDDDPEPLCPDCKTPAAAGFFRADVPPGHPEFGKLQRCYHPFHSETRAERLSRVSQLGREDLKRTLDDIKPNDGNQAMLDAARQLTRQGYGWLYVWGGPGNAKSEVLKAIVNHSNNAGKTAIYSTFGQIADYIRAGYSSDSYTKRLDQLKTVPVLAIDEMDKPRETDWLTDFRFHFLDARYMSAVNRESITVFAGNPNPAGIFDEVLFDRFRDGRFEIIENTAPSAREYMQWQ